MLKTCSVALLAIAMSIGVAQARHVQGYRLHVIPACAVGQPTAWKCNCGSAAAPLMVEGPECRG